MLDNLNARARFNYVDNILNFLFLPAKKNHKAFIENICNVYNLVGFRHNSNLYYRDKHCALVVAPGKVPKLPAGAKYDWEEHLIWYQQYMRTKERLHWLLSEIASQAKDRYTLYHLTPDSLTGSCGLRTNAGEVPSFSTSWALKEIAEYRTLNKDKYLEIETAVMKRLLLS